MVKPSWDGMINSGTPGLPKDLPLMGQGWTRYPKVSQGIPSSRGRATPKLNTVDTHIKATYAAMGTTIVFELGLWVLVGTHRTAKSSVALQFKL